MQTFLDDLGDALDTSGLSEVGDALVEVRADVAAQRRRVHELSGEVGAMERAAFFVDTADETAVKQAEARIVELQKLRRDIELEHEGKVDRIAARFAPFGVWVKVEGVRAAARASIFDPNGFMRDAFHDRARLEGALTDLIDFVLGTWAPGFDPAALEALGDAPGEAAELARRAPWEVTPDPSSYHEPMGADDLLAACAERLVEGRYHARHDALERWDDATRDYQRLLLLDELHGAISALPPLEVVCEARALFGAVDALSMQRVSMFAISGGVVDRQLITPLATVFVAAERLAASVERAFPGLSEVAGRAVPPGPDLLPARDVRWLRPFFDDLSASEAPAALAAMYTHASVLGWVLDERRRNSARISRKDRLVFWHDTPEEAREPVLDGQREVHRSMLREQAQHLARVASEPVRRQPLLGVRAGLMALSRAVAGISTTSGRRRRPFECELFGLDEAHAAWFELRSHLAARFHVTVTRYDLMHEVARVIDAGEAERAPRGPLVPLSADALARRIAGELASTGFAAALREADEIQREADRLAGEVADARGRVSTWDALNPFSESQEQRELGATQAAHDAARARLDALAIHGARFDEALTTTYLPAAISFALTPLAEDLKQVHAVCRRYTLDDNTYYECVVRGRDEARDRVAGIVRLFSSAWGDVPADHALLTRWAVEHARGWGATRREVG
jgi:hypothetical protein